MRWATLRARFLARAMHFLRLGTFGNFSLHRLIAALRLNGVIGCVAGGVAVATGAARPLPESGRSKPPAVSVPARAPVALGLKVTLMVQNCVSG